MSTNATQERYFPNSKTRSSRYQASIGAPLWTWTAMYPGARDIGVRLGVVDGLAADHVLAEVSSSTLGAFLAICSSCSFYPAHPPLGGRRAARRLELLSHKDDELVGLFIR